MRPPPKAAAQTADPTSGGCSTPGAEGYFTHFGAAANHPTQPDRKKDCKATTATTWGAGTSWLNSVGTGGRSLQTPASPAPANVQDREKALGILRLTLHPTSFSRQFVADPAPSSTPALRPATRRTDVNDWPL